MSNNNELGKLVQPRIYRPNWDKIVDNESLVEFLKEMGVQIMLIGDQTFEDMGKRAEWWVEIDQDGPDVSDGPEFEGYAERCGEDADACSADL